VLGAGVGLCVGLRVGVRDGLGLGVRVGLVVLVGCGPGGGDAGGVGDTGAGDGGGGGVGDGPGECDGECDGDGDGLAAGLDDRLARGFGVAGLRVSGLPGGEGLRTVTTGAADAGRTTTAGVRSLSSCRSLRAFPAVLVTGARCTRRTALAAACRAAGLVTRAAAIMRPTTKATASTPSQAGSTSRRTRRRRLGPGGGPSRVPAGSNGPVSAYGSGVRGAGSSGLTRRKHGTRRHQDGGRACGTRGAGQRRRGGNRADRGGPGTEHRRGNDQHDISR
jgi:hypothetical protein